MFNLYVFRYVFIIYIIFIIENNSENQLLNKKQTNFSKSKYLFCFINQLTAKLELKYDILECN